MEATRAAAAVTLTCVRQASVGRVLPLQGSESVALASSSFDHAAPEVRYPQSAGCARDMWGSVTSCDG